MHPSADYNNNVFINCPFDSDYTPLFNAIVFAIYDCGFIARCTLEEGDASEIRLETIYALVTDCKYGIHDISRTDIDQNTGLPRFNMPFELGVFLAAKKFGGVHQRKKKCLIMDKEQYRYRGFISDISGQDVEAHESDPSKVIEIVRNWLRRVSRRTTLPGGLAIWEDFQNFQIDLPDMCNEARLDLNSLIYNDFVLLVIAWLKAPDDKLLYDTEMDMPPPELVDTDVVDTVEVTDKSKVATQKRLDEDTKKVGYVRGEIYEMDDGKWGIHWGGEYPL